VTTHRTLMQCGAPHPLRHKFPGQQHGIRVGVIVGYAVPTGRVVKSEDDVAMGCVGGRCKGCGVVTEYRIVLMSNFSAA
jgi:hypothetical protein